MVDDYSGWQFRHDNPHAALRPPPIERLAEITVPMLVIVGERDHPDFRAMAQLLASEIPGAELVTLAGVGHMANMEAPDQFNEIVLSFLDTAWPAG
jgi:3-oxoadipate enol-lactonase